MNKKRFISFITAAFMLLCTAPPSRAATAGNAAAGAGKYEYFLKTPDAAAYVMLGSSVESRYCTFIDGRDEGITDSTHPLYSEDTTLDGLDARYFNNKNVANIAVDKDFYGENDHEFLFSVAFYDFGPSRGTFYFDYYDTAGEVKRITLIKPGTVQGWFVKTIYADDADLSKAFENGGNIRLVTGGYNAFKKVEITNLSKTVREGGSTQISALASDYGGYFKDLGFISAADTAFDEANMYKPATAADVYKLMYEINGGNTENLPAGYKTSDGEVSTGELCAEFLKLVGLPETDDPLAAARAAGIVTGRDLFFNSADAATRYNLLGISYNAFYYAAGGDSLAVKLIQTGKYTMDSVKSMTDPKFLEIYYQVPIKCPYTTITDYETGRTFKYINFFGEEALRPYVTMQSWTSDGEKFIGGTRTGYMFLYDTTTQTLTFVDDNMNYYGVWMINATIGTDDCIYYVKKQDGHNGIWKADTKTLEKTKLTDISDDVSVGGVSITNDCRYIGFDYTDTYNKTFPAGIDTGARYCIETNEWDIFPYEFEFSQYMNHVQVNPVYPNLMFFCHEAAGVAGLEVDDIYDRMWVYDLDTSSALNVLRQGIINTKAIQTATHEVWSNNGEYLYFIMGSARAGYGRAPAAVRLDKDGRHRQYFYDPVNRSWWHCYPSGDDRYVVVDGNYVTVINTDTHQTFKITRWIGNGYAEHPYHPHPHVAREHYKVNWGMRYEGVLGIMWYDFSEIDEGEIAPGGREAAGENATLVSYKGLSCETAEVQKGGRKCLYAKKGKAIYIDVSDELIDTVNGKITVELDYYDQGGAPIALEYTSGVETDNDYWRIYDAKEKIARKNTKRWKTAVVTIESGNFENAGEYCTDLKISGISSDVYISNIKIKKGE